MENKFEEKEENGVIKNHFEHFNIAIKELQDSGEIEVDSEKNISISITISMK